MMQAGEYYVGDLCYVFDEDEWDEVLDRLFRKKSNQKTDEGEFELEDGRRYSLFSTKYGDGIYVDQYNHRYTVDAGIIGCIRVKDLRNRNHGNFIELGAVVEFTKPFQCFTERREMGRKWDGVINIGHLRIETGE